MKIARRIIVAVLAGTLGLGAVGAASPAQAAKDTTWGYSTMNTSGGGK